MDTKLVAFVCLALVTVSAARGQLVKGFGVKVGPVIATQIWDYQVALDLPVEARWGLDAGVFIEVLDLPVVSLLGELHYTQKGFTTTVTVTTAENPEGVGEKTYAPRADYICLPILLKLRLELGTVTPYLAVGPRFDFLVGHSSEDFGAVFDNFKKNETGASFGLGLEIPADFVAAVMAEIRYSPNISKAFDNGSLTVKNESLELLIGARF